MTIKTDNIYGENYIDESTGPLHYDLKLDAMMELAGLEGAIDWARKNYDATGSLRSNRRAEIWAGTLADSLEEHAANLRKIQKTAGDEAEAFRRIYLGLEK